MLRDGAELRLRQCKEWDAISLLRWLSMPEAKKGAGSEDLWGWESRLDAAEVVRSVMEEQGSILTGILSRVDRAHGELRNIDRPQQS